MLQAIVLSVRRVWQSVPNRSTLLAVNARRASPEDDDARVRREVGERIRDRRNELGLTMKQLGERLVNSAGNPVPATQVSKWERGVNFPAKWQWVPIATALAIDLDQLFAGLVGEQPEWSVKLEGRMDALEAQLSALARLLGVEDGDLEAAIRARATAAAKRARQGQAQGRSPWRSRGS